MGQGVRNPAPPSAFTASSARESPSAPLRDARPPLLPNSPVTGISRPTKRRCARGSSTIPRSARRPRGLRLRRPAGRRAGDQPGLALHRIAGGVRGRPAARTRSGRRVLSGGRRRRRAVGGRPTAGRGGPSVRPGRLLLRRRALRRRARRVPPHLRDHGRVVRALQPRPGLSGARPERRRGGLLRTLSGSGRRRDRRRSPRRGLPGARRARPARRPRPRRHRPGRRARLRCSG